jgi:hypothetical protein
MTNGIRIRNKSYRHVFLVQNRAVWKSCSDNYDRENDLVLSFDFAVVNMVKLAGGEAQYIDHIVGGEIAEIYNYKTYDFFASWYKNAAGQDIFRYRGIDVGPTFRIEIWNDLTYYIRLFLNLHELFKGIKYEKCYVGMDDGIVKDVIRSLGIVTTLLSVAQGDNTSDYYFPMAKLMDESLHRADFRSQIRARVVRAIGKIRNSLGKMATAAKTRKYVYVEYYNSTKDIILELQKSGHLRMIRSDFNGLRDVLNGLQLPISAPIDKNNDRQAKLMLDKFIKGKCATLLVDGTNISQEIHALIFKRISPLLARQLQIVDDVIGFFAEKRLCLMVTPFSLGLVNQLMINYCQANNVPVYTIINGLLANSFLDEAKDGTWINAYGESIKRNYFKGMDNIVCLGDPRMDEFAKLKIEKRSNCQRPTIGIGASLASNVDLNSYFAVEFEFLNDIMSVLRKLKGMGREMDIIIKLRQNNYIQQYRDFLDEYYPDLAVTLWQHVPMAQVYEKVDLYISLASQTLFEASSLGIPVLYYKNDTHYYDPPFDGSSELVTALTPDDLLKKMEAFYDRDNIYETFKEKPVMEKYVGPLDGQNLRRNMDFIYSQINANENVGVK